MSRTKVPELQRFLARINDEPDEPLTATTGCYLWIGKFNHYRQRYEFVSSSGRTWEVAEYAYTHLYNLTHNPAEGSILHTCPNDGAYRDPSTGDYLPRPHLLCVRKEHLYVGSIRPHEMFYPTPLEPRSEDEETVEPLG